MGRAADPHSTTHEAHLHDIELQLTAIAEMSLEDIQQRWQELGFDPTPQLPLRFFRRLVVQRLQEQALGADDAMAAEYAALKHELAARYLMDRSA